MKKDTFSSIRCCTSFLFLVAVFGQPIDFGSLPRPALSQETVKPAQVCGVKGASCMANCALEKRPEPAVSRNK